MFKVYRWTKATLRKSRYLSFIHSTCSSNR